MSKFEESEWQEGEEPPGETFIDVPQVVRERSGNHYESLEAQLEGLVEAGFCEVACHYRYGLFGIYSGRKA